MRDIVCLFCELKTASRNIVLTKSMGHDFHSHFTDQRDHRAGIIHYRLYSIIGDITIGQTRGCVAPVPQALRFCHQWRIWARDHGNAPQRHLVSHAT